MAFPFDCIINQFAIYFMFNFSKNYYNKLFGKLHRIAVRCTQNKMKQLQLNRIKPLYDKYGINNNNNDVNDGNNNEDIQERIRIHNI